MANFNFKILVINNGLGNIGSLVNALNFLKFDVYQEDNYENHQNINFDGFVLPGVGSFPSGIKKMKEKNLDQLVYKLIEKDIPGLGICLGMQLLAQFSFEGGTKTSGLNLFKGNVERIQPLDNSKVPHIGWTDTQATYCNEPWQKIFNNAFYYIHSYAVKPKIESENIAKIEYGKSEYSTAIYRNKLLGVQFHPEKSQQQGLKLLNDYFNYHG